MNWISLGSALAGLAVTIGAFGAHALKGQLDDYSQGIYQTAFEYHALHALALIAFGIFTHISSTPTSAVPGWLFAAGTLLFSGSLYLLAITGMKWLGAVTPLGGTAWIIAWIWFAVLAWKSGAHS